MLAPASERPRPVTRRSAAAARPTGPSQMGAATTRPSPAPSANARAIGMSGALMARRHPVWGRVGVPAPRPAGAGSPTAGRGSPSGWRGRSSRPSKASRASTMRAASRQLIPATRASSPGVARLRSSRGVAGAVSRQPVWLARDPRLLAAGRGAPRAAAGRGLGRRGARRPGGLRLQPVRDHRLARAPSLDREPAEEARRQERDHDHLARTIGEPLGEPLAGGAERLRRPASRSRAPPEEPPAPLARVHGSE